MLEVILIVDAADEGDGLIAGPERPLALITKRERTGMPGLRLLGVLFWMALPAGCRTGVLAGCCLEKQRGQHETACYQISLPLN